MWISSYHTWESSDVMFIEVTTNIKCQLTYDIGGIFHLWCRGTQMAAQAVLLYESVWACVRCKAIPTRNEKKLLRAIFGCQMSFQIMHFVALHDAKLAYCCAYDAKLGYCCTTRLEVGLLQNFMTQSWASCAS